jgi:hypothetical protein
MPLALPVFAGPACGMVNWKGTRNLKKKMHILASSIIHRALYMLIYLHQSPHFALQASMRELHHSPDPAESPAPASITTCLAEERTSRKACVSEDGPMFVLVLGANDKVQRSVTVER